MDDEMHAHAETMAESAARGEMLKITLEAIRLLLNALESSDAAVLCALIHHLSSQRRGSLLAPASPDLPQDIQRAINKAFHSEMSYWARALDRALSSSTDPPR